MILQDTFCRHRDFPLPLLISPSTILPYIITRVSSFSNSYKYYILLFKHIVALQVLAKAELSASQGQVYLIVTNLLRLFPLG